MMFGGLFTVVPDEELAGVELRPEAIVSFLPARWPTGDEVAAWLGRAAVLGWCVGEELDELERNRRFSEGRR